MCIRDSLHAFPQPLQDALLSLGADRIHSLDVSGVSVQVLSHAPTHTVSSQAAKEINDRLSESIKQYPNRLAAFAFLSLGDPVEAAKELERCVKDLGFLGTLVDSHFEGRYYDDEHFCPVFETAERLGVPVYLHPRYPTEEISKLQFRGNYGGDVEMALGAFAFGW